jgi:hypothetical protein
VSRETCACFKKEGYRLKRFREAPVTDVKDIVQLGYLDVNRTMRGIEQNQAKFVKEIAREFLHNVLNEYSLDQGSFDELHREACCRICSKRCRSGAELHYGQAQKLINMALKYSYNEFFLFSQENHLSYPDNCVEKLFHLPIDSQIRGVLVNHCGFPNPSPPWSQWGESDYWAFQSALRKRIVDGYFALEIDYLIWNYKSCALLGNAIK